MRFIAQLAGVTTSDNLVEAKTTMESLVTTVVNTIGKSSEGDKKDRLFFPDGEKLEIELKFGTVDISVKVAGPKAT